MELHILLPIIVASAPKPIRLETQPIGVGGSITMGENPPYAVKSD